MFHLQLKTWDMEIRGPVRSKNADQAGTAHTSLIVKRWEHLPVVVLVINHVPMGRSNKAIKVN